MTECGLTNLATCLPEMFFEFVVEMLNSPIEPLLEIVQTLMTEPVNIDIFSPLWAVMLSVISIFYALFFMFAGFNLMISGYDSSKRDNAKTWLRNVILMILFVQASFFLYDLIIEFASLLTSGMMNIIDPDFFLLTVDDLANIWLYLVLLIPYITVLSLAAIFLAFRYVLVSVGVVFFPLAIFLYFIPPLAAYGKMILNVLMVIIFITFFDAVILFGASAMLSVAVFSTTKILLVTVAFLSISLLMGFLIIFAILKAALSVLNTDIGRSVKKAVKYVV